MAKRPRKTDVAHLIMNALGFLEAGDASELDHCEWFDRGLSCINYYWDGDRTITITSDDGEDVFQVKITKPRK